jgi:hypothetical protein
MGDGLRDREGKQDGRQEGKDILLPAFAPIDVGSVSLHLSHIRVVVAGGLRQK